jgi:8-oxo-dGTP pyrophosphatase MutT (NUDIX family)
MKVMKTGAYIIDPINKKILITISNNNKIGIPKGTMIKNEDIYSAAMREIYEETGLRIYIDENTKIKKIKSYYHFFVVYIDNGSLNFFPNPIDTNEINESKWVDIKYLNENINLCNTTLRKKTFLVSIPWKNIKKNLSENNICET